MTGHDILRSIGRLVADVLPGYEVGWFVEESSQRPCATVVQSTPVASIPFGSRHAELVAGFAVVALPARADDPAASAHEAGRVAEALLLSLTRGQDAALVRGDRAHPARLPVWDYSDVGPSEGSARRAGVARIEAPAVQVTPDPREPRAYLVTCDLRAEWSRSVAVADPRPLVGSVPIGRRP